MNAALNGTRRALRLGTGLATCISCAVAAHVAMAQSLPELANAGGASISTTGTTMTVDANAANRVINWNTFSVDAGNTVNFVSTSGGSTDTSAITVVNRVIGTDVGGTTTFFPSYINGSLNASNGGNNNISLWLVNPAGITFGPTGGFSGGSLVMSTLDFLDGDDGSTAFTGTNVRLKARAVTLGTKLDVDSNALTAMELRLVPSDPAVAGLFRAAGSVVLLGEQVVVGKSVQSSGGDIAVIAASDARFTSASGSPLSYTILAGTRLDGARVLASGDLAGRNIVLAASNATDAIKTLLQVDSGARLVASEDNGRIELTASSNAINMGDTLATATIDSQGSLRTTGVDAAISVIGNGSVTASGLIATGDLTVRAGTTAADTLVLGAALSGGNLVGSAGGQITLGTASAQQISADGTVTISNSVSGDIVTGAGVTGLVVRSNLDGAGADALNLDSRGSLTLGDTRLDGGVGGTAAVTLRARTGSIEMGASNASRFAANAVTGFASSGTIRADNSAAGAGVAASIVTTGGTLDLGGALIVSGLDQDAELRTGGNVAIDAGISASRNIEINATIGGTRPTSVVATGSTPASQALSSSTGRVRAFGDDVQVTSVSAGTDVYLEGDTVTIGAVSAGGTYAVAATGDITLGTANNQRQLADGLVSIVSSGGSVRIGQSGGSNLTGLIIGSNNDSVGTEGMTIRALSVGADVDLGTTHLSGGAARESLVRVEAADAIVIGSAMAAQFIATAGGAFTASGAITAGNDVLPAGSTVSIAAGAGGVSFGTITASGADHDMHLSTSGAISGTTVTAARNVTLTGPDAMTAPTSITVGSVTAIAGSINANAANLVSLGSARSEIDTILRSGGTATIGTVTVGRNYSVQAAGDITLGTSGVQTQAAAGVITITSTAGSILQGSPSLALRSNSDGTGTEALTLSAANGAISLGATTLNGGAGQESAVTLTAGGNAEIGGANTAAFTATADGNFTSNGAIRATGDARVTAGGDISLTTLTSGDDVTLTAPGAISVTTVSAQNNLSAGAAANGLASSLTAGSLTATNGAISGRAATLNVGAATSGQNTAFTATTGATVGSVTAGGNYTVTANGDITLGTTGSQTQAAAGIITVTSAGGSILQGNSALTLRSNSDGTGTEALTVSAATGAIALGGATLNGGAAQQSAVSLTSGTTTTINRANAAAFTANAGTSFVANGAIAAADDAAITASNGDITLTSLTVTGADNDATLKATGAIAANTVTAARNVTVAGVAPGASAASFTVNGVTATAGSIDVKAGTSDIGAATSGVNTTVTGTSATIGSVTAGGNYTVATTGNITLGKAANQTQSAGGAISLTSSAGSIGEGASGLTLRSNSDGTGTEALTVSAATGAIALGGATLNGGAAQESAVSLTSGTTTTINRANAAAFTANAGTSFTANGAIAAADDAAITASNGDITLTSLTVTGADNDATLKATGAIAANTVTAARNVTVAGVTGAATSLAAGTLTATAGQLSVNAGTVDVGRTTSGLNTAIVAGGNATIGTLVAGTTATVTAGSNATVTGTTTTGGNLAVTGSSGTVGLGRFTAGGNATFVAKGLVTLAGGTATGKAVTISGRDAQINGVIAAKSIDIANSGTGTLRLGDGTSVANGDFALSRTELSNLQATDALTLGSLLQGGTAQNVQIGTARFSVPATVSVLAAAKRIDVTGAVTFGDSTGTLKVGGDVATASGLASLIYIQAKNNGTGGMIVGPAGVLELGAANILAGQADLASDLGVGATATGDAELARLLNTNPASKVYFAGNGSSPYVGNVLLVQAGAMKVNYTGFAVFQNTGVDGITSQGVVLGGGTGVALEIASTSTNPVFALFGSINNVQGVATSLLGNPPLAHFQNVTAARINGCVIGGGNCQSVQNVTPAITGLDNVRNAIFFVKPDFQVPFDPLVGTNNDALFDDVGSFGLGELPMTPIECSEPDGRCDTQQKDGK